MLAPDTMRQSNFSLCPHQVTKPGGRLQAAPSPREMWRTSPAAASRMSCDKFSSCRIRDSVTAPTIRDSIAIALPLGLDLLAPSISSSSTSKWARIPSSNGRLTSSLCRAASDPNATRGQPSAFSSRCPGEPLRFEGEGDADAGPRSAGGSHPPGSPACSGRQENQHPGGAPRTDLRRVLLCQAGDTWNIGSGYCRGPAKTEHGDARGLDRLL